MTPKALPLAVLYAIAEQVLGKSARFLEPYLVARHGLRLG